MPLVTLTPTTITIIITTSIEPKDSKIDNITIIDQIITTNNTNSNNIRDIASNNSIRNMININSIISSINNNNIMADMIIIRKCMRVKIG